MKLIFAFLLISTQTIYAQETKLVTKKRGDYKEEYYVLTKEKKIKQGAFKRIKNKDEVVVEGEYKNNEKIGEWKFYLDGEIEQIYNYSNKKLTHFKSPSYSFKYIGSDPLDIPPLFIGGKEGLNERLNELMNYPAKARQMGIEGKVIAEFSINEDNSISGVLIIRGIGVGCDDELSTALKKINDGWLAGEKESKKVKSKVTLTVQYKLNENATTSIALL